MTRIKAEGYHLTLPNGILFKREPAGAEKFGLADYGAQLPAFSPAPAKIAYWATRRPPRLGLRAWEYAEAIWQILQQEEPPDDCHRHWRRNASVREFVQAAFQLRRLDGRQKTEKKHVKRSERYLRPMEVDRSSLRRIKQWRGQNSGWQSRIEFRDLVASWWMAGRRSAGLKPRGQARPF